MVTFEQAKKIYADAFPDVSITAAFDIGDAFVISGIPEGATSYTGCGLTKEVAKRNGTIQTFILPDEENFIKLDNGVSLM